MGRKGAALDWGHKESAKKQVLESSTNNAGQATAMADIFWKNVFDLTDDDNNPDNTNDNDDLQGNKMIN